MGRECSACEYVDCCSIMPENGVCDYWSPKAVMVDSIFREPISSVRRVISSITHTRKPKVNYYSSISINNREYQKMVYYTNAARGEISGLGKVGIKKDKILVTDVLIFRQECSHGGTVLDKKQLSLFVVELIQNNKKIQDYKLWWHSHNDFDVFWSPTDEKNILELSKSSQLVSICINKMGNIIGRIDTEGETEHLHVNILPAPNTPLQNQCIKEVREKVRNIRLRVVKKVKRRRYGFYKATGHSR